MEIAAVVDEGLGNSSYVVDLGDGSALVVDPERDPRPHLAELERRRLTPRWVVETHLHADFVSGAGELATVGARLLAPAGSGLAVAHRPLAHDQELDLGGLTLRALATPGHTPEHLAYLLLDGSRPVALFSGGTLIAGGIARPDLILPELTEPLARDAYRSIQRLLDLPDDLPVHPTHGAGSFCSATPTAERTTTIGTEKATNPLLAGDADEDTFVARALAGLGSYPPYFRELREVNRAGVAVYGPTPPSLPALTPDEVESAVDEGAVVVDARDVAAFAAGHVPGAVSNPWRASFATWLAWLVGRDRPLVLVADDAVDREDLVWAALTVGVERLLGELAGGVAAWQQSGRELATTPLLGPGDVEQASGRRILDVRQRAEHAGGHVPGAAHVELGELAHDPGAAPPGGLLVHCGHGERAASATSLLERAGHRDVAIFLGGPDSLSDQLEVTG